MRFGCCVGLDKVRAVQEAGYDYVELPVATVKAELSETEFEPILEEIRSLEIVPEAWNCLLPGDMKVTGPEVDKYRVERYLRTAFERIEELGGEVVVFGSGGARNVPDGFPMEEAQDQIVEFLTLAGQIAGMHGLVVAIEPLNSKESNIINSVAQGLEFVRRADHPFVKVLADLYHIDEEQEPLDHVVNAGNDLVHTHTADTGRYYPGSGSYPHREFFERLRSIGYNDRMSVECKWDDFETECVKALEFLRKLDAEVPY
ncbi:MAG: sugar phosphate isomerase/epimerase [Armatimonadetes bacterium]|nr:sugar phosphate isomerase/epimerase [Armatimonadota bacterium]